MQLNLNNFQEEVHLWKNLLRRKDKEIETLQQSITKSSTENKVLENTCGSLLQEVAELNSILSTLHTSISRFENHEEEKKTLSAENKRLEDFIKHQKKIHKEEINDMNKKVENLKSEYKKETEVELLQLESTVSAKQESYLNSIKERDKYITKLEDEASKIKYEKDQEMLKLKVEYEEMINKMKNKLLKAKVSNSSHDNFFKDDVFRQKYLKLEKEAREESELLKLQIQKLNLEVESLKNHNCTTAPPNLVQDAPKSDQFQSIALESLPRKRVKLGVDEEYQEFDNMKNKFLSNSTQLIRPVKKKLFNLDFNYF